MYSTFGQGYDYQASNYSYPDINTPPVISPITTSSNQHSLESSSSLSGQDGDALDIHVLETKTKQLSLDSAYTSESDLDTTGSENTVSNSGTTSPKCNSSSNDRRSEAKTKSAPPSPQDHKKLSHHAAGGPLKLTLPPGYMGIKYQETSPDSGLQYTPSHPVGGMCYGPPMQTIQPSQCCWTMASSSYVP